MLGIPFLIHKSQLKRDFNIFETKNKKKRADSLLRQARPQPVSSS